MVDEEVGRIKMEENKRGYEIEEICYTQKQEPIGKNEITVKIGNILEMADKIKKFMNRNKKSAMVIPVEELEQHDTALFQTNTDWTTGSNYCLENILTGFQVDRTKGRVTAKKLYKFRGEYIMETRTYLIRNYGKTWRAWTALPDDQESRWGE